MNEIKLTVVEHLLVPDGVAVDIAPTGAVGGFRLADGRLLRPWICYEIEDGDGNTSELTHDEVIALNFDIGLDFERQIEGDLPEIKRRRMAA